ncbi:MAG: hypothetical protein P1V35_13035, partial [Planctomycetota bacterium]|nr:hypothetical protein [Planctomycetota bacterium]
SGGYTDVRLETAEGEVWAAGTAHNVTEGAQLIARGLTPMPGFRSATLDRTFEQIFFCDSMMVTGANAAGHAVAQDAPSSIQVEKAEGGQTVVQMFTEKDAFVGKQVTLRGKVVKFSAAIMGKNWIHLQDGSGESGTNDLTITTAQTVAVGDTVTVQGTLVADKDFGYGYKYAVIIEDAKVTVE